VNRECIRHGVQLNYERALQVREGRGIEGNIVLVSGGGGGGLAVALLCRQVCPHSASLFGLYPVHCSPAIRPIGCKRPGTVTVQSTIPCRPSRL